MKLLNNNYTLPSVAPSELLPSVFSSPTSLPRLTPCLPNSLPLFILPLQSLPSRSAPLPAVHRGASKRNLPALFVHSLSSVGCSDGPLETYMGIEITEDSRHKSSDLHRPFLM
ncbi:hypothetical protein E2C01_033704 [Portunus trituberculatus]|uniref:Uncharacterized protein n=1 Tax=Portunus trituberculatus TaxID=210409 RepID=A0A5B7F4G6_PORTR|nr:hypothetical protein [Portunus trituberculatus]